MVSPGELDQFVSLWQSGHNAKLYVETEAGNAFVQLQVGLGQAPQHPQKGQQHVGGHRGGGPARERRRMRREAARKATVAAEEAVADEQDGKEILVAEEATENIDGEQEEEIFQIPQIDGTVDSDVHYELQIEAHDTCTHDEVVEALEANFYGTLDDENEEKNSKLSKLSLNSDILQCQLYKLFFI